MRDPGEALDIPYPPLRTPSLATIPREAFQSTPPQRLRTPLHRDRRALSPLTTDVANTTVSKIRWAAVVGRFEAEAEAGVEAATWPGEEHTRLEEDRAQMETQPAMEEPSRFDRENMRMMVWRVIRFTVQVKKIPPDQNNIAKLNEHFAQFGNIVNMQIRFGDAETALITYATRHEATAAYKSPTPVLNNRFIKASRCLSDV